jgi:ribosome-associated translation inhibitor RaiA
LAPSGGKLDVGSVERTAERCASRSQTAFGSTCRNPFREEITMQIQIDTGKGIGNKEALARWADTELTEKLSRFRDDITRVEVYLTDNKGDKGGANDLHCSMQARLGLHQLITVNHHGTTQDEAFRGALAKLLGSLESATGRLKKHRDRESIRKDDGSADA